MKRININHKMFTHQELMIRWASMHTSKYDYYRKHFTHYLVEIPKMVFFILLAWALITGYLYMKFGQ